MLLLNLSKLCLIEYIQRRNKLRENCILLFVIDIINLNISKKKPKVVKIIFKKITLINDVICSSNSIITLLIKRFEDRKAEE